MKKALLLFLSCLFSLALAEGVVRLSGRAPEIGVLQSGRFRIAANPVIGYEPIPDFEYTGDDLGQYDYRGRSNSLGYRDREHSREKPPGTYRILVLGDSIAAGFGIERTEDAFPARLESLLREKGLRAEVLSFAVSGYNTRQEVATLEERGLAFHPDLVLVAYCLNDRQNDVVGTVVSGLLAARARGDKVNPHQAPPVLVHSALYRLLRYRLFARPAEDKRAGDTAPGAAGKEDTVGESFARLGQLSRQHGFKVLVAVFPRFRKLDAYGPWLGEHRSVAALSNQLGFTHLDLLDTYRSSCWTGDVGDLAIDRWHPTVRGQACAAEAMAQVVRTLVR